MDPLPAARRSAGEAIGMLCATDSHRGSSDDLIRDHLDRILHSDQFRSAPRQQAFLRFIVHETLAGRGDELKETLIATQVYEKPADYDPRVDSTVRVEASKLRQRLQHYYEGTGADDQIRLSIPKGAYQIQWGRPGLATPQEPAPLPAPSRWAGGTHWRHAFFLMSGLMLAGVVFVTTRSGGSSDSSIKKVSRLTEPASFSISPAISPRGDFAIYSSDRDGGGVLNLWSQPLDGGPAVRLSRSAFNHYGPSISSDGRKVVFRSEEEGGVLMTLPISAGATPPKPRRVNDSEGGRDPRFSPKGTWLVYWVPRDEETSDYGRVFLASLSNDPGHGPVRLFGDFAHAVHPIWSDSGKHVLTLGTWHSNVPEREFDAWIIDLDGRHSKGGPRKTGLFPLLRAKGFYHSQLERSQVEVTDWRDGWLYLSIPTGESLDLFRIRLRPEIGTPEGVPERLTLGAGGARGARMAANGRLVFAKNAIAYDLHSLETPAPQQPAQDLRRHTSETGINFRAAVLPSGQHAVWEKRRLDSGGQVWFLDLASGARRRLGWGDQRNYSHALLSPDGQQAAFRLSEPGKEPIYLQPVAGGEARRICENCGTPADWTADGRYLFYITGGTPAIVGRLEIATGKSGDLIRHPSYNLFGARVRLDSKGNGWAALYADNSPRTRQIFLVPMKAFEPASPEDWVPVTSGAHWDQSPAWALDGRTLYFTNRHDGFRCIMARQLDASGRPVGAIWTVRHFHAPGQTLMRTITNRGADALWVAGRRIFFMLDSSSSDVWSL